MVEVRFSRKDRARDSRKVERAVAHSVSASRSDTCANGRRRETEIIAFAPKLIGTEMAHDQIVMAVNAAASGFFRDTLEAVDGAYLRPGHDGFLEFQEAAGRLVHRHLRDGGRPDAVLDAIGAAYRDSLTAPARGGRA